MSEIQEQHQSDRVVDLKTGAHVIFLDKGLYCVLHAPGQRDVGLSGLPGVRVSRAPLSTSEDVEISTFSLDGWLGATHNAALVRVNCDRGGILVTVYQELGSPHEGPRLQVMRLFSGKGQDQLLDGKSVTFQNETEASKGAIQNGLKEVSAHIQKEGDVVKPVGSWMGKPGSGLWIEGFSVNPASLIKAEDIEYQAVLGKGWLSPWSDGGQFCGSRGMSLPILGLCIRLKDKVAKEWRLRLTGCFTDGTKSGPHEGAEIMLESEGLAPLEAFQLEILPVGTSGKEKDEPKETHKETKKTARRSRAGSK